MQIQKGLVKYKDRTDIVCTYGVAEDGKQYYFLDNTSIRLHLSKSQYAHIESQNGTCIYIDLFIQISFKHSKINL